MRNVFVLAAVAGLCAAANAQVTYSDSVGDIFDNGFDHLDLSNVVVNHDANNIYFTIHIRSNNNSANWGKYCIGIDTGAAGGDTSNGWGRNISWSGQGIDYWVGTWADDNGFGMGGELRQMDGTNTGGNVLLAATYGTPGISGNWDGQTQSITVSRTLMGLVGNQTFRFDVITTGSNADPGVDHLSNPNMATPGWGTTSQAGQFLSYTIPAPSAAALLGLSGLAMARRRR